MTDNGLGDSILMDDIAEVLIPAEEIQARVADLGAKISTDYAGKDPLLVGVLRGVFVFMADLTRAITIPIEVDFIGITRYGRRILAFDHDRTRAHSPITEKMGKVVILESKSVREYLQQLDAMGESTEEYAGIYGYSIGHTEPRLPLFEYPRFEFAVTDELTNLDIGEAEADPESPR